MAVLTDEELKEIRRNLADYAEKNGEPIDWTKPQINQASQAVEDEYTSTAKQLLIDKIETVLPGVFTLEERKRIVRYWKKLGG